MPAEDTRKKLTIVIPAYNEEKRIGNVLEDVKKICSGITDEIIVVNDGSTDRTGEIAEEHRVKVIHHARNRGYGASLKSGIREANTDYVVTMDADGQHKAEDVLRLLEQANNYDMVSGKRVQLFHSPLWRMPGKWLIGFMAGILLKEKVPDLNSGLRLMRRDIARKYLHICPLGFSFSTTMMMAFLSRGYKVAFVPIDAVKRKGESTVSIATGMETIILVLRIIALFNPLRFFIPISVLMGAFGFLWGLRYVLLLHGVSVGAMLCLFTAILLFSLGLICDQISQLRLERFE
ncbi:MAG: glycosyltransferase family 2 protein [bacterium]